MNDKLIIGLYCVAAFGLPALKYFGIINWSWIAATALLWLPLAIAIVFMVVVGIIITVAICRHG
jgi:hypothetical protein